MQSSGRQSSASQAFGGGAPDPVRDPLSVIINYQKWLPLTENWIYTQARHLPDSVTPHIVCGKTTNIDQFRMEHLTSFADLPVSERVRLLAACVARLGRHTSRRGALLADVAQATQAPIVHSHFGYTGYYSAAAVKRLGLAHVVTFYGVDMSALPRADQRWRARYARLFDVADKVLCEGPHMAEQVRQLGCPPTKLQVHHLGVDLDGLPFRPRRWSQGEPLRVLMAASFREKKGLTYGIRALDKLATEIPLEVTIIGDAGANPKSAREKARIHETFRSSQLGSRVRFLGYQPHSELLREAYKHHVFLSPSVTADDGDSEGGAPITLIEMAATGMPLVSSRHADIPGVILDGETGLLAEERDVDGITSRLRWLAENPHDWTRIVTAARAHVEVDFSARTQADRLAAIYRSVRQRP